METLTFADTRKLLQSIHAIYSLRDLDTFGCASLAILEQLVPADAAVLASADGDFISNSQIQCSTPDLQRVFTPEFMATSIQHAAENPLYKQMPHVLKGAHTLSDFATLPELQRTEGYQFITKAIGSDDHIGLALYHRTPTTSHPRGRFAFYALYQDWNRFTDRDRLILSLFQPHLSQAFQTALHCQQQHDAIAQLQHALDQSGMIFLDPVGSVLVITAQAERWLRQYFPTPRTNRQLPDLIQAWVGDCLRSLQADGVPPVWVPLRLKQGDRQLVVRLVKDADQDHYLLLLAEELIPSLLTVLRELGLTPREAQILAAMMQGQEPKAIAQTLQIRPATVRKHLENIYRKLHVQSQTEAVALVLEQLDHTFQL